MSLILKLSVLMMKLILKIKPDLVEGEDNLGNKINKRMVGIKLGAYNDQSKPRKTWSGPVNFACL